MVAQAQGLSRHNALPDACHKRARPVIMTTMAMGAGMLPTALGLTADASLRIPMAVAVIGGLITEPPRDSWRLQLLRGWSHDQASEVFPGSA